MQAAKTASLLQIMNKFNILHIITDLSTGGAEYALYNLLNGGLAIHFNNHILSLRNEGSLGALIMKLDVPVTALGIRGGVQSLSGIVQLHNMVKSFQPHLIQGWMYHGNVAATVASLVAAQSPLVLWNVRHSLYKLSYEKVMTRQVIRMNRLFSSRPATILYNSQVARKQHESFGFSVKQGKVIPNGINVDRFVFSKQSRKNIRTELAIPEQALVVGHVARLHPMKDHPLFLRAAVIAARQNDDVHFVLSGRNVTMKNNEISQLIPECLHNRFHLLGERSDIPELMAAMDIFSSSSYGEGFPNVIGEAMSSRLPCVVTDVGDSRFIVDNTGIVTPPHNQDAMVTGLKAMLQLSAIERKQLGEAARQRIIDNFSLPTIVEQYSELYEKLLEQNKVVH